MSETEVAHFQDKTVESSFFMADFDEVFHLSVSLITRKRMCNVIYRVKFMENFPVNY